MEILIELNVNDYQRILMIKKETRLLDAKIYIGTPQDTRNKMIYTLSIYYSYNHTNPRIQWLLI